MVHKEKKLVNYRLNALRLAKRLGNISEACRRCRICRTTFYNYKKRFQANDLAGLKNSSHSSYKHPQVTSPKIVEKILFIADTQPKLGCFKISKNLKSQGIDTSFKTVQKILTKRGLGTLEERISKSSNSAPITG
ncbi:MAG: helix-turn-helix domain-containing protein [Planctomycetes bacterium]|nr:helix-turn-helix domain-containing protein [Planctomycetota bacterium]MCK5579541.1 helix-turn-helix domain-containing protein [Planctomycetota bacterium]